LFPEKSDDHILVVSMNISSHKGCKDRCTLIAFGIEADKLCFCDKPVLFDPREYLLQDDRFMVGSDVKRHHEE
jgi:hypothetical protein